MYRLNINRLHYTKLMLLLDKISRIRSRVATDFYYVVHCSLLHWSSFVVIFLSFTCSRNMKNDSVSFIICNRQTISLATYKCMILRNQEFIRIQRNVWKLVFSKRLETYRNAWIICCINDEMIWRFCSIFYNSFTSRSTRCCRNSGDLLLHEIVKLIYCENNSSCVEAKFIWHWNFFINFIKYLNLMIKQKNNIKLKIPWHKVI